MKQNMLKEYKFLSLNALDCQFNRMIDHVNHSTRHCQDPSSSDPYPWLEPNDPRHNMSDEEILDNTINLSNSCLSPQWRKSG